MQSTRPNKKGGPKIADQLPKAASAWPTPTSRDGKGQTQNPERMDYVPNIVKAWGTPQGASQTPESHGQINGTWDFPARGEILCGSLARTEKFAERLEILSAWLMAYPWSYLKNWERKGDKRRKIAK